MKTRWGLMGFIFAVLFMTTCVLEDEPAEHFRDVDQAGREIER